MGLSRVAPYALKKALRRNERNVGDEGRELPPHQPLVPPVDSELRRHPLSGRDEFKCDGFCADREAREEARIARRIEIEP